MNEGQKKRILEAWEKPLAMPRPVPKPGGGKKKGRKPKEEPQSEE